MAADLSNPTDLRAPSIRARLALSLVLTAAFLAGCSSTTVRSTAVTPIETSAQPLPEHLLPDVGIDLFSTRLDDDDSDIISPVMHSAEERYFPFVLSETLQKTGQWGVVRVNPGQRSQADVYVSGVIRESDGETLKLTITARDATGRPWFERTYEGTASKFAYDRSTSRAREPFQGVYNRIANDLLEFRESLTRDQIAEIRQVAELRFAEAFAPEVFDDYVRERDGRYELVRLPAENDPFLARIRRVRERDYLFVDTLQDYYDSFALQMEGPYYDLRRELMLEAQELRQMRRESTAQTVGGALAILAGILAQGSSSSIGRTAGVVGIGAGAIAVQRGLQKRTEASGYADSIKEISRSFGSEVEPYRVELEDRTVTLTGTVEEQYEKWQALLKEIYEAETGLPAAASGGTGDT